jgi:FkbM family methyltransferase
MQLKLADTVWGPHVVPANDVNVGLALLMYGEFSVSQAACLFKLLKPGDVALDIGANIGALSLPMLHAVGPTGRVICFEPQPKLARVLSATLALNAEHPDQYEVRQCALGAAPGTLMVPPVDYDAEANNFGCVELAKDGPGTEVSVRMLDLSNVPPARVVKIDAEGMEREVLLGAEAYIRAHKPILMVENDREAKYLALIAQVEELGYDCYWFVTALFNPENSKGDARDIYGPDAGSIDMLCFPKGEHLPDFLAGLPQATEANAAGFTFSR